MLNAVVFVAVVEVVLKSVEKRGPAFWLAGVVPAALLLAGAGPMLGWAPFFLPFFCAGLAPSLLSDPSDP